MGWSGRAVEGAGEGDKGHLQLEWKRGDPAIKTTSTCKVLVLCSASAAPSHKWGKSAFHEKITKWTMKNLLSVSITDSPTSPKAPSVILRPPLITFQSSM